MITIDDDSRPAATSNPFGTMALQLLANARHPPERVRFNPHPPGVPRQGSASCVVLDFLSTRPKDFFTRAQLLWHTKRSAKSVDWALLFLRSQHLVEVVSDETRNPRYLRYRIRADGSRNG